MPSNSPHYSPELSFIDYWNAVDAAMVKLFDLDTSEAGIEPEMLAYAQENAVSPEEFALSYSDWGRS